VRPAAAWGSREQATKTYNIRTIRHGRARATRWVTALVVVLAFAAALPIPSHAAASPLGITASLGAQTWQLSPSDLGAGGDGAGAAAGYAIGSGRAAELRRFAERIAHDANIAPVDAHVEDNGLRQRLVPSVVGRTVRVDDLIAALQRAADSGQASVPVPVDQVQPAVTTDALLQKLGITALLATGDSDFAGSDPGRATNVRLAARIVDGTLVPPEGIFSYNHALGPIAETPGFVQAEAVEGGGVGSALGGGVCQISTTIFRAALRAGLPIVEWWPHAFRFPVYEQDGWGPGFDASIAQADGDPMSGGDFKFANPTDHWMLVRVVMDGTHLAVQISGAPTDYVVELDKPQYANDVKPDGLPPTEQVDPALPRGTVRQIEPPVDGLTVTVVRRVRDGAGNVVADDTFVSTYQPRGAVLQVSPDMAGAPLATPGASQ